MVYVFLCTLLSTLLCLKQCLESKSTLTGH
jgi:hypothetical protein